MDKMHIDRRVEQMKREGVNFQTDFKIGKDIKLKKLIDQNDAVILACGAEMPRDLNIPGRNLEGVHLAMDFLPQQNRRIGKESFAESESILADGKHVVVIGGGDTGSDCIGTSIRQGALSVTQLEIMSIPPAKEDKMLTWPNWPLKMRTSSSQEEGARREFSVMTEAFLGDNGVVKALKCIKVDKSFKPEEGTNFSIPADLVLLAMGFVSPITEEIFKNIEVKLDNKNNVLASEADYKTSHKKLWVAGDMRRGQSLVVWAIREGRQVAKSVDEFLMGNSSLAS